MAKTKQLKTIADLKPDPMNVNKGTERGAKVIDWSLTELGAGRSILADADGVVIAGNKTLQGAISHGLPIRVVETEGEELVVVQRKDLRLTGKGDERKRARQLAIADNRASEVGYVPDVATLLEHIGSGVDVDAMYSIEEVNNLHQSLMTEMNPATLKHLSTKPPPQIAWALIGIPLNQWAKIDPLIQQIAEIPDTYVETTFNDRPANDENG